MSPDDLDFAIAHCGFDRRFYQHLIAMKILRVFGKPKYVADLLKVSLASVYKWG